MKLRILHINTLSTLLYLRRSQSQRFVVCVPLRHIQVSPPLPLHGRPGWTMCPPLTEPCSPRLCCIEITSMFPKSKTTYMALSSLLFCYVKEPTSPPTMSLQTAPPNTDSIRLATNNPGFVIRLASSPWGQTMDICSVSTTKPSGSFKTRGVRRRWRLTYGNRIAKVPQ